MNLQDLKRSRSSKVEGGPFQMDDTDLYHKSNSFHLQQPLWLSNKNLRVNFVVQKQHYLSKIRIFFENVFLTKIKTSKSVKKGSENSERLKRKTHKYFTNSVFDRFILGPFLNNHTTS